LFSQFAPSFSSKFVQSRFGGASAASNCGAVFASEAATNAGVTGLGSRLGFGGAMAAGVETVLG